MNTKDQLKKFADDMNLDVDVTTSLYQYISSRIVLDGAAHYISSSDEERVDDITKYINDYFEKHAKISARYLTQEESEFKNMIISQVYDALKVE